MLKSIDSKDKKQFINRIENHNIFIKIIISVTEYIIFNRYE